MNKNTLDKSKLVYEFLDNNNKFKPVVLDIKSRSNINIPFIVDNGNEETMIKFLEYCYQNNIVGLRTKTPFNYKDLGMIEPLRVSLYNGISLKDTKHLIKVMSEFIKFIILLYMGKSTIKRNNKKRTKKIKRKLIKRKQLKRGGSDFAFSDFEIPGYNRTDKILNKTIKKTSSSIFDDVLKKGMEKAKKSYDIQEENEKLIDQREKLINERETDIIKNKIYYKNIFNTKLLLKYK